MANNPNVLKNLTHFKKGQTGNPNGRPKKLPNLEIILANVLGEENAGVTEAEAIVKAIKLKAVKGDVRAAELLLDRAWGKLKQDVGLPDLPLSAPVIKIYTTGPELLKSE